MIRGRCVLVTLLASLAFTVHAQVSELTFITNVNEDYPFLMGEGESLVLPYPGVAVEIIRLAEAELGIPIRIVRMPWKRALEVELAGGKADGAFFASYLAEREAFGAYPMKDGAVDVSRAVNTSTYRFYRRKGESIDFTGTAVAGLKGPVGVPRGYSVLAEIKAMGCEVLEVSTPLQGFQLLKAGRIELLAGLQYNAEYILSTNPDLAAVIEPLDVPISTKHYYLMLSRQFVSRYPELAERIWTLMARMSALHIQRIYAEYMSRQ